MNRHVLLTYALNSENKLVNIDSVSNGLNCNCRCPGCNEALIAKNCGEKKEHHFAHKSNKDCPSGNQTAIHLLAKEIIQEEKKIPFVENNGNFDFVQTELLELEKNLGDIKPDVYGIYNDKPIAVEILVTHEVDQKKYYKIENHKLTTFEIDLSEIQRIDKNIIKNSIYNFNNIKLIYDFSIMNAFLNKKRELILREGVKKEIKNGIVKQCPMACVYLNRGLVKMRDVRCDFCEKCFFSSFSQNEVLCIGHMNGQIPEWFIQANINESRYMPIEEAMILFKNFKDRIRKYLV